MQVRHDKMNESVSPELDLFLIILEYLADFIKICM